MLKVPGANYHYNVDSSKLFNLGMHMHVNKVARHYYIFLKYVHLVMALQLSIPSRRRGVKTGHPGWQVAHRSSSQQSFIVMDWYPALLL